MKKKILLTWFLKRDCLKILAVSFSKINQVSFVAMISFSFIIIIILIITIVFLILILICLYFQFIFYPSLLSIIFYYFYIYFLSFYLFLIFPRFFPFCHFSFFCASSECHYFQFYPYWSFKNPPRRTPRLTELSAKLKSL